MSRRISAPWFGTHLHYIVGAGFDNAHHDSHLSFHPDRLGLNLTVAGPKCGHPGCRALLSFCQLYNARIDWRRPLSLGYDLGRSVSTVSHPVADRSSLRTLQTLAIYQLP